VYQRLEKGNNADYWQDITVIVEDELHKLRKLDSRTGSQYEAAVERREGINKAVLTDVQHIFRGQYRSGTAPIRFIAAVKRREWASTVIFNVAEPVLRTQHVY
jgi:hypothetical protein